jgi:hypothetical protein
MDAAIAILIIITAAAGIAFAVYRMRKKRGDKLLDNGLPIEIPEPRHDYATPKGISVQTVNPISESARAEVLATIDVGIEKLFSTLPAGYTQKRRFTDYPVIMIPPTSRSIEGYPSLNLKNGWKIAGTVILLGTVVIEPPFILVAENWTYMDYLSAAVRNEGEHIAAWYNDKNKFWETTVNGDVHPIFPDENGQ